MRKFTYHGDGRDLATAGPSRITKSFRRPVHHSTFDGPGRGRRSPVRRVMARAGQAGEGAREGRRWPGQGGDDLGTGRESPGRVAMARAGQAGEGGRSRGAMSRKADEGARAGRRWSSQGTTQPSQAGDGPGRAGGRGSPGRAVMARAADDADREHSSRTQQKNVSLS
jgi:hypothetical protein